MKIEEIEIKKIKDNPYQTREEIKKEPLKILTRSILKRGLINPISLLKEGEEFIVISGHRRLGSFKSLKRKTIPAIVKPRQKNKELMIDLIHENLVREDLSAIEKANSIKLLLTTIKSTRGDIERMKSLINMLKNWKKRGYIPESRRERTKGFEDDDIFRCMDLLKSIGVSENGASNHLSILNLPRHMQNKVMFKADRRDKSASGKMNIEKAYQLSRVQDREFREELFKKAVSGTNTKIIQALVDMHLDKINKGEWNGIKKSNKSISSKTTSGNGILELSNSCNNVSARLNSWKLTKLIQLSGTMTKELFVASMISLKKELRLLDESIDRKLKDKGYVKVKEKVDDFEIVLNLSEKKHNFRFSFPMKIVKKLGLEKNKKIFLKLKVVERLKDEK